MTTTTNLKTVDAPDLPDDPRDCCRQIIQTFKAIDDYPSTTLAIDGANLLNVALETFDDSQLEICAPGLAALAWQVREVATAYHDAVQQAWTLARHGTGDHREYDAKRQSETPRERLVRIFGELPEEAQDEVLGIAQTMKARKEAEGKPGA